MPSILDAEIRSSKWGESLIQKLNDELTKCVNNDFPLTQICERDHRAFIKYDRRHFEQSIYLYFGKIRTQRKTIKLTITEEYVERDLLKLYNTESFKIFKHLMMEERKKIKSSNRKRKLDK